MNGQLEFYNVDEGDTMATNEHFMCTDIDWDPTGATDHRVPVCWETLPAAMMRSRSARSQLPACRAHP